MDYDSIYSFIGTVAGGLPAVDVSEIRAERRPNKVYMYFCFTVKEVNTLFPKRVYGTGMLVLEDMTESLAYRLHLEYELEERRRRRSEESCEHSRFERMIGICNCDEPGQEEMELALPLSRRRTPPEAAASDVEKEIDLETLPQLQKYEDCPICIETFTEDDWVRLLPCGHVYHDSCVKVWLVSCSADCPTCRHDFTELVPIRW